MSVGDVVKESWVSIRTLVPPTCPHPNIFALLIPWYLAVFFIDGIVFHSDTFLDQTLADTIRNIGFRKYRRALPELLRELHGAAFR